jgi:hypothetical protein
MAESRSPTYGASMRQAPTAVLIVRVWTEEGSPQPLRAHVRSTSDVADGFEPGTTTSDLTALRAWVDAWLEAITAS